MYIPTQRGEREREQKEEKEKKKEGRKRLLPQGNITKNISNRRWREQACIETNKRKNEEEEEERKKLIF